jgi:hypothetical protein
VDISRVVEGRVELRRRGSMIGALGYIKNDITI